MKFEDLAVMTVHITGLMRGVIASILAGSFDMSEIFSDSVFAVIV
jgi:hypothetical protein